LWSETACMIAEEKGKFKERAGVSPFLNFTKGVLRLTFSGTHSFRVRLGSNRYSLKVRLGSL